MKRILVLLVAGLVAVNVMAGDVWEKPQYGSTSNASLTYTFNGGTVGELDNVMLTSAPAITNTVGFSLVQNGGAMTNVLPSVVISNSQTSARWTSGYLMAQGDRLVLTFSAAAPSVYNQYALWFKNLTK